MKKLSENIARKNFKEKLQEHQAKIYNEKFAEEFDVSQIKPTENGWWKCDYCMGKNSFLFYCELVTHWKEICPKVSEAYKKSPKINTILSQAFGTLSAKEIIERDIILSNHGWICQICPKAIKYDYKFQLLEHWLEYHIKDEEKYKMCQWCMEFVDSSFDYQKVSLISIESKIDRCKSNGKFTKLVQCWSLKNERSVF